MKKTRYTEERVAFARRQAETGTPVAEVTREALAIDVDQGIKGEQVVAAMARIASVRGAPKTISRAWSRPNRRCATSKSSSP